VDVDEPNVNAQFKVASNDPDLETFAVKTPLKVGLNIWEVIASSGFILFLFSFFFFSSYSLNIIQFNKFNLEKIVVD